MKFFTLYVCVTCLSWALAVRSPGISGYELPSVTDSKGWRLGPRARLWPGFRVHSRVSQRVPPERFVFLPGVHITCSSSEVIVRVKKPPSISSDAKRLRLGRSCVSNGADRLSGDLLFRYPITACDVVREVSCGVMPVASRVCCSVIFTLFPCTLLTKPTVWAPQLGPAHILYRFVLRYSSRRAGVLRHRLECHLNR